MPTLDEQRFAALLEEYKALRHEIEQAYQLRLAVLAFTATAWAGMAGWLIANRALFYSEPTLVLLHIPLVVIYLLLKAAERHVMRISTYIREFLEPEMEGLRWESRVAEFQQRSPFVLSTSQIVTISLFVLSVASVALIRLFNFRPLMPHPRWLEFAVLVPLWLWLSFKQIPALLMLGSRTSEEPSAQLWSEIKNQSSRTPPELPLEQRRIFIGVPVHNKADTVSEALRSIYNSISLKVDVNIVSYDDASTDQTHVRLSQLHREIPVIKVVHSNRRLGKAEVMNVLSEYARRAGAEVLCFCDPDILCGSDSLDRLIACIETSPRGYVSVSLVLPRTEDLQFPMREIFRFKAKTEEFRRRYRTYINGRAFGMRTQDFPGLPRRLHQCDDRYLTVVFGKTKILGCAESVVHFNPPRTLWAFFVDRCRCQERLIRLSKEQPQIYRQLRYRRFSLFHNYVRSYPKEIQRGIMETMKWSERVALAIERVVLLCARISAEVMGVFRPSRHE